MTIVAAVGGGDWNTGTSWVGGVAPTAADDAQIPATAGNMSIGAGAVCRSADFSTYTGTLSGTGTLTIGDATAGLSSIALKLVAGMTFTSGALFSFVSTSATVQTVDFAGKNPGNVTFNATSNGSWQLTGTWGTSAATCATTLTKGTLDLNGQTCFWSTFTNNSGSTRTLTCGASVVTMVGSGNTFVGSASGLTLNANTSEIILTGTNPTWNHAGTWNKITFTPSGQGTVQINTPVTCATLTFTCPATKTEIFQLSVTVTVTGAVNLAGNSSINRLLVDSNTVGTARTITNSGATMTITNCDFQDISLGTTWNASAQTDIGDCGGNTNITFPASVQQTWSGTSGGNWSANAWTTRVPLPQDDVVIASAFSASQTVTNDMPRLGRSIDWTGSTGSPTWSFGSVTNTSFGSVTLISGMSILGSNDYILAGRSSYTITSAGKQFLSTLNIKAPSGTYTLNDAISTTLDFTHAFGGFNANGFNLTARVFDSNNSNIRSLTLGSGIFTLTSTSNTTVWAMTTTTNLTFSGASGIIIISTASANTRFFSGGGKTYGTLTYTVAGSTGLLQILGSNTFTTINFSDVTNARTLQFIAGTTTTVGTFNVNGTSGKLITVNSQSGAAFTMTSSNLQSCDYLNLTNSVVDATPKWYAGANSVDNGGNTNWIFTAPPSLGGGLLLLGVGS